MILKKLEIYGFKSFADRIHMKFDIGITAIVGPNGSGKSNIADAVRWVLGEQSAKSLRGSKMEDIIFSGTQVRKSLGFAEVSLTLDNTSGALPVEYAEVTITRRVFRSGESEYYINRNACRLKDIVELFMDTGVGKEGYSIIGQGRIDEILSSRSEDRRYIFEEAAGIVKYKSRREEAEKKLEKTQDNLMRVEDILSELDQQLEPLKEQSQTAREYLRLKEQLKVYEINQFLNQYHRHTEKIEELKEQILQLENETVNRKDAVTQRELDKETLSSNLHQLKQIVDDIRKERFDLINSSERLKGELNLSYEKIKQYERDNTRLLDEIGQEQHDLDDKKEQMSTLASTITDKSYVFDASQAKASILTAQISDLDSELTSHQKRIDETKGNIIEVLNKISDCRNHLTRYRTIESSLNERLDKISELSGDKLTEQNSLIELESSLQNKIIVTKKQIQENLNAKTTLEESIKAMKQTLFSQEEQIQKEKQQLVGKDSRLKLLVDMKKGYEGFNKSVKEVLLACQSNNEVAHKVCGVIASLITVPKDYELAVETVLGGSLQHIVTEHEEDAKYLIGFLRKHNYGRATFLPISSIRGRSLNHNEKEVLKMKGCCGIASDIVSCDPKYKDILENLLGRVVVAEDLDAAVDMARRFSYGFRIVTLLGDVVNPGGSMTGGSSSFKGISILGRNREITDLQQEIASRKSSLAKVETQREDLFITYRANKDSLEEIEAVLRNMDHQRSSEEESLNRTLIQKAQSEKELSILENERIDINQNLEELSISIKDSEQELTGLEEKNADINEWASESKRYLKEKLEEKETLNNKITDVRVELASMQQEIQALKDQTSRIEDDIRRFIKNIDSREQLRLTNTNEINRINGTISETNNAITSIEQTTEEIQAAINKNEKQYAHEETRLQELEHDIKELSQSIVELTDKKYRFEVQFSRFEVELETYQNKMWEEYELTYSSAIQYQDASFTLTMVNQQIQVIKKDIAILGEVNVNAIEEFKRVSERFTFLSDQKGDMVTASEDLKGIIKDITKTMEVRFIEEFAIINEYFGETFRMLFGGGNAQLVLENQADVLSCGIEITAQPPGKKLQSLLLLSGGERSLTAIAILFAILKHKPTPFCVLDEIDAALDDSNVDQFSKFVKDFAKDTQFIIITHRKGTMEVCDVLYGIAMEEKGVSKLISVKFDEMVS